MRKLILIITIVLATVSFGFAQKKSVSKHIIIETSLNNIDTGQNSDKIIGSAFNNRSNNLQVEGQGVVTRILPDELVGSRHQRFIVRLNSGQTLRIAHNIDLAPRVNSLKEGDKVFFYGVYEWNEKGGTIHWTHHDPAGRHTPGWIKHNGIKCQ